MRQRRRRLRRRRRAILAVLAGNSADQGVQMCSNMCEQALGNAVHEKKVRKGVYRRVTFTYRKWRENGDDFRSMVRSSHLKAINGGQEGLMSGAYLEGMSPAAPRRPHDFMRNM